MGTYNQKYPLSLDKSSRKFYCPNCEKKRFVQFVDIRTGHYLPNKYGRCERIDSCGYYFHPNWDGYDKKYFKKENWNKPVKRKHKPKQQATKFIRVELFKKSQSRYNQNNFVIYLYSLFDKQTVNQLIHKYCIGTSSKMKGGCIFYQIDIEGNIRRGKIMAYNPETGKRDKKGYTIDSVHSQMNWKNRQPEWRFLVNTC